MTLPPFSEHQLLSQAQDFTISLYSSHNPENVGHISVLQMASHTDMYQRD